jgi:hypothetical protein
MISYLRSLPLNVDQAYEEILLYLKQRNETDAPTDGNDDNDDFPQNLAAAFCALDEVKRDIASLAGDEYGAQSVEILAKIAAPYSEVAARCLLHACLGYCFHLSTHRYGSHVLQTILQLSITSRSLKDLALYDDAPPSLRENTLQSLPSLEDLIRATVEELSPHSAELAQHLCGSHVLRTLLCVLGGVTLVTCHGPHKNKPEISTADCTYFRGKPKSKRKKRKRPTSDDSGGEGSQNAGTMSIVYIREPRVDLTHLYLMLESITQALLGEFSPKPGKLQLLACDASVGPLLIVLIRVLTYSCDSTRQEWTDKEGECDFTGDSRLGIAKTEPRYTFGSPADKAVRQILCWQNGETVQEFAGDVIYSLAGDTRGSHLLETVFRLCYDEFYSEILRSGDFFRASSLQEYAKHDVSNFVLQTILVTIRTKEQAESMLKATEKIISSGLAIDPAHKRRGIVWRAAELASKYRVEQDGILKAIRLGFLATTESQTENDNSKSRKKKERKKASAIDLKDCIPLLLHLERDSSVDRISLDVAGSRTVYHLLRFSPRLCEEVLDGIIRELSTDDIVSIAKDGLGSRCILDGILDGPIKTSIFQQAIRELRSKLAGRCGSLANHRVGHHVVRKLFTALSTVGEKENLADEIIKSKNSLQGNVMGRSIMEHARLDLFDVDKNEWKRKVAQVNISAPTSKAQ